ncbi:hypothetical protein HYC85_002080 [Camellia sinensis]|uniref:Trichome birefringence-like N-terminal domain-containing protein n=1 Tax=Camellia sinensis TaxID=4442 RepID=A0A7J7I8G1_CAMSI|nr:hypothetical protein HYC85_002080 [Camellia sinensis]
MMSAGWKMMSAAHVSRESVRRTARCTKGQGGRRVKARVSLATEAETRRAKERRVRAREIVSGDGLGAIGISFPLYKELECSFIDDGMACERFGRKVFNYQHWRWQPHDCDLPSLSYEILTCTAMAFSCFNAIKEFNASIDFYWALLLVQLNSDDLINHRIPNWIVRVQAIEKHARYWVDADILVFNSYIWWRRPKLKVLWGSFGNSDGIYKEVEMLLSYELALRTWLDWLHIHINRTKTICSSQACTKTKCSSQACHPLTRGLLQIGCDWEQMVAAQNFGPSLERAFCRSSELCVLDPFLEPGFLRLSES